MPDFITEARARFGISHEQRHQLMTLARRLTYSVLSCMGEDRADYALLHLVRISMCLVECVYLEDAFWHIEALIAHLQQQLTEEELANLERHMEALYQWERRRLECRNKSMPK